MGLLSPFFRVFFLRPPGVPHGQFGPVAGAVALVEADQVARRGVAGNLGVRAECQHSGGCVAQVLALQRQERQLIYRIEQPQASLELQAVEDHRLCLQADVFGPKVAVALDDLPLPSAAAKQPRGFFQQAKQSGGGLLYAPFGDLARRCAQPLRQVSKAVLEPRVVLGRTDLDGRSAAVERGKLPRHLAYLCVRHGLALDQAVEHALCWKPPHLDEPLGDLACSPQLEPPVSAVFSARHLFGRPLLPAKGERHEAVIDVLG